MLTEPLLELEESYLFGLWPKRLSVFEDRLEVQSPGLLDEGVEVVGYDAVERVVLHAGAVLSNLLIQRRGQRPILLRGADLAAATRARKFIEDRAGTGGAQDVKRDQISDAGLLRKLSDLRDAGLLSPEEFEAKKRDLPRRS